MDRDRTRLVLSMVLGLTRTYALLLVCATLLIFSTKQLPSLTVYAAAGVLVLSLLSIAALSEHKRWAWPLEIVRLLLALALVASLDVPAANVTQMTP